MSRLFWKMFLVIWFAQIIGTMSVMVILRLEDEFGVTRANAHLAPPSRNGSESAHTSRQQEGTSSAALPGKYLDVAVPQEAQSPARQPAALRHVVQGDGQADPSRGPPPVRDGGLLPPEPFIAHLVASLLVAVFLAHYLLKPVRSLRSAFHAVASGNFHSNIGATLGKRRDELAELLLEFDRMAVQLRASMDSQQRLLHDVSHEMRSPLARMQAAIGLARQQHSADMGNLTSRLEREISRMDHLVGELLALSRLDVSRPGTMDDDVWIDDLLAGIVEDARFEAESRKTTVLLSGECQAVMKGNAELLHRAIENVVRNAIKHAGDGSAVVVAAECEHAGSQLKIVISDNGPGVPEAELDEVFQPFFRGSRAKRDSNGHGLGLALAKRAIEVHAGTIRAFNLPDGGLCVEVILPLLRGSKEAAPDGTNSGTPIIDDRIAASG